ncbi:hypothetical protein ACTXT7_011366, partial [Hymenolepis weldensis]
HYDCLRSGDLALFNLEDPDTWRTLWQINKNSFYSILETADGTVGRKIRLQILAYWRQQSRPGAGYTVYGLCETSNASDREEFWLFGPLIPLGMALSVHMQVNFMMRSCADREIVDGRGGTCRENFDVFLQQETRRSDMDTAEIPKIEVTADIK